MVVIDGPSRFLKKNSAKLPSNFPSSLNPIRSSVFRKPCHFTLSKIICRICSLFPAYLFREDFLCLGSESCHITRDVHPKPYTMAFSKNIVLTVAEEFEQYVRVGFKSDEYFQKLVSAKAMEERFEILGEMATVGKLLVRSRIAGNQCRDAESGALASYLVRVLDKVMVAAGEGSGSQELVVLGMQLGEASNEAADHEKKMKKKLSDIATARVISHLMYMVLLAIVFWLLVVTKVWSPEAAHDETNLKIELSHFSRSARFTYVCFTAVVIVFYSVIKHFSSGFWEVLLDFVENFAPTVFSGVLHLVERVHTEKRKDANEMFESWSWMHKVASLTNQIIQLCAPLPSGSSGPAPGPDVPPSALTPPSESSDHPTAQTPLLPQSDPPPSPDVPSSSTRSHRPARIAFVLARKRPVKLYRRFYHA